MKEQSLLVLWAMPARRVPNDGSRSARLQVCRSAALSALSAPMMMPLGVEELMSVPSAFQRFNSLPYPRTSSSPKCPPLSTRPMDTPHNLRLPNVNDFLSDPNRNQTHTLLGKNNSRSLSTHGLHIPPHLDSRHHRFFEVLMRFPLLPPPPESCSSLEVSYTAPSLEAMIYI